MKLLSLLFLFFSIQVHSEGVFYNSCDETKTSATLISMVDKCSTKICEMNSLCKSNKGEVSVSHTCPTNKNGKCPSMIDCIDNETIITKSADFSSPSNVGTPSNNNSSGATSK